jgi:hypothetical protein
MEESKSTASPPILLEDIIRNSVIPETLDADNMWECSGCKTKVQAVKSQKYKELPNRLMVHLKRFRFDPTSRRRRKLNTPVLFTELLDVGKALAHSEEGTMYKLSAVLIHTGTAMGGHYKAVIRDSSQSNIWKECNDANVKELTSIEVADLLSLSENKEVTSNLIENKSSLLRENSYMLLYQKVDDNKDITLTIPASIEAEISKSNEEFDRMSKLLTIHKKMTELSVYFSDNTGEKHNITTFLPSTTTLQETMFEVLREIAFNPVFGVTMTTTASSMLSAENVLSLCRLRGYNRQSGRNGETYDDNFSSSLAEVNIVSHTQLLLEFRTEQDPVFVPFNPNEFQLNLSKWEIKEGMTEGAATTKNSIIVPGEDMATVGGLRGIAATLYGVELDRVVLIVNNNRNVTCLDDDSKLLRKDVGIFPGDNVVTDFVPADVSPSEYVSPALAAMRTVVIFYNDPASTSQDVEFNQKVHVSLSDTLYNLKSGIAEALKLDVSEFHIRRNTTGPQLKGEKKTLQDYSLSDQSIVFIKMGGGLQVGEHVLVFQLEIPEVEDFSVSKTVEEVATDTTNSAGDAPLTPTKQTVDENNMGEMGIKEKFTVLELKEQIISNWDNFKTGTQKAPESVHHLRLKDGKASSSGPLRNDRILSRCLLGMADGRKVSVQVLQKPEIIGQEDLVLSVRLCSYDTKSLSRVIDFPLNRTSTVENLYESLLNKFPHLKEDIPDNEAAKEMANISIEAIPQSSFISIAKGFSTGPPLTLKSALKLKWNDKALFEDPKVTIDIPPLNLRDGSVIAIRGVADFARAKETQRLKKIKEASEEKPNTGPVMSRPKSRAFGDGGRPAKRPEQGIIIVVTPSKDGGLPPSPDKENTLEIDGLPSAPVRMVKHLKQEDE